LRDGCVGQESRLRRSVLSCVRLLRGVLYAVTENRTEKRGDCNEKRGNCFGFGFVFFGFVQCVLCLTEYGKEVKEGMICGLL
jgi:hypothetical protein